MSTEIGFAVIYRWKIREGMESEFQDAWRETTALLMKERGGLGSRLHRTSNSQWIAYAQWPSEEAWLHSRELGSVCAHASEQMRGAVAETFDPILLYPEHDLLTS
jgi:heme-degrading monooxygenase HmoA